MGRWMSPHSLPWLGWQHPSEDASEEEKEEAHIKFEDWISNPQNLNLYAYVKNNPLNYTDPAGMAGCQSGDKKFETCTITVTYDKKTHEGTLVVTGQNKGDKTATILLTSSVVVGGDGHITPTGTFTAKRWEGDHTSKVEGRWSETPYSKTWFGTNAFGPWQLHMSGKTSNGQDVACLIMWPISDRIIWHTRMSPLRLADHEVLSGGLHHINRKFTELVDFDDPLHLRQQTCEQAEVPAGEPGDRRSDFWRDLILGQVDSGRRPMTA